MFSTIIIYLTTSFCLKATSMIALSSTKMLKVACSVYELS